MADYIDREELLKCANAQAKVLRGDMLLFVQDMITSQCPIDAVEVVRCKDCKFNVYNGEHYCAIHDINIVGNYYCASGVKNNEIN